MNERVKDFIRMMNKYPQGTNVFGQQIQQPQTAKETVNVLKSNLPKMRGAVATAIPYIPVAGSIYDIVAGGKKVLSPTKEGDLWGGLGQAGLGALGLVPGMQWARYAKAGKLAKLPVASKIKAVGFPTAGALVGSDSNQAKINTQPVPLETITEQAVAPVAGSQDMNGVQYTVLPEPPNSNAVANDMAQIIGAMGGNRGVVPTSSMQMQTTIPQQQMQQQVADDSIARALIDMYNKQYQEMQKPQAQALKEYKRKLPYANISDALMRAGLASYAQAYDIPGLANAYSGSEYTNRLAKNYELDQAIAGMPMNRFNAVNTLAGNIAVANQMGMDPAVAMADKDIQKVLTAYNQIGGRENVANINAMAKMYGADRGVDIANIKAMAQALSTDARLSATERMYYANLANKLDIARMNATVAPYRFGYDITPEYVDLINSGASIQAPIVPSTNVLGGMLGNQGFTNQLDFNRINRGN
jgi:hypothetical protein